MDIQLRKISVLRLFNAILVSIWAISSVMLSFQSYGMNEKKMFFRMSTEMLIGNLCNTVVGFIVIIFALFLVSPGLRLFQGAALVTAVSFLCQLLPNVLQYIAGIQRNGFTWHSVSIVAQYATAILTTLVIFYDIVRRTEISKINNIV